MSRNVILWMGFEPLFEEVRRGNIDFSRMKIDCFTHKNSHFLLHTAAVSDNFIRSLVDAITLTRVAQLLGRVAFVT